MLSVAFIGMGVMGAPMAGHLKNAGYAVTVYNRTHSKAVSWVEQYGGQHAPTPASAAQDKDVVITCVGNDDDLRDVLLGEQGAVTAMQAGSLLIDHTTASANIARELSETLKTCSIEFLDAPVSGGEAGARNGQLTIMAGGERSAFEKAAPIFDVYSKMARLLGPAGSGQLCKMVNQICIGGLLQALSEAINFADNAGLDLEAVMSVITKGAAQSWQMENRWQTMQQGSYEHGFAVDWMRKDFALVLDEAARNGSTLPVTALVDQFYADVQSLGGGRWDTSSLLARIKKLK
ncbi:NAD(P)-dependent oxidoreductase [Aurantivibrio plasticivorans]